MDKRIKIILVILVIVILGYILYPKNVGFTEKMKLPDGTEVTTIGQYRVCLGITLSEEIGDQTNYRCIGIPFWKITI